MTSPLVYLFAAAAVVLALWFALAAFLSYVHATTRQARAAELEDYLAVRRGSQLTEARSTGETRARVMHISIGDLVRDAAVADAAARGLAGRDQAPGGAP